MWYLYVVWNIYIIHIIIYVHYNLIMCNYTNGKYVLLIQYILKIQMCFA